jgi:hypothetical protein
MGGDDSVHGETAMRRRPREAGEDWRRRKHDHDRGGGRNRLRKDHG